MIKKKVKSYPNFIKAMIDFDMIESSDSFRVTTRFPPEPNGYLHLGHAKAICLNFQIAELYNGICKLRFDDTNPSNDYKKYIKGIKTDLKWLGFDWYKKESYASDYFDSLYKYALILIQDGKAYVDDLSFEEIKSYRGSLVESGIDSPFRKRSIDENLKLFNMMKNGNFSDGEKVLRAKIDMSHSNLIMRDPILYRIRKIKHHRTEKKWCIYPMYDFAHCLSDLLENISYSFCTLEFENNRPLYEWIINAVKPESERNPKQIEFARLDLTFTVLSKRKLKKIIDAGYVSGWDDPRMPTISGLRRRGYTPESIVNFCNKIGVAKKKSLVDFALLEHSIREDLNYKAPRFMAVLNPLKVVITNYPENKVEELDAINNPEDSNAGTRKVPFTREIYIEKDDFMESPVKKFFRLAPGREVRLRYAFLIKCTNVIKDSKTGDLIEIHCIYDPDTKGGNVPDDRKVKATLHWVSVKHAIGANVMLYDRLFLNQCPDDSFDDGSFRDYLNPNSLEVLKDCKLEPNLTNIKKNSICQFERLGYFCLDGNSSKNSKIFNRVVTLRDSWLKFKNK